MNQRRRIPPAPLAVFGITLLMCISFMAARRFVIAAMENDQEFSPVEGRSTPSAIGSLLVGTSAEIGDMVFLDNVRLQAGPKAGLFVVSGTGGVRMLVSLEAPKQPRALPSHVEIKGTIRRLPAPEILRKGWRLSKDQVRFFGNQQVYIAAEYVKDQNSESD